MILKDIYNNLTSLNQDIIIIADGSGWVIDNICYNMESSLRNIGLKAKTLEKISFDMFKFSKAKVFYFINRMPYLNPKNRKNLEVLSKHNSLIAVWWHSDYGKQSKELIKNLQILKSMEAIFSYIQVSCSIERDILISHGISAEKLVIIHEGIEEIFLPCSKSEKLKKREVLGIPEKAQCVGYFQKDGIGWGDGETPKLEKGPDIFIEVIKKLKKKYKDIFVVLTGPSRGYVKNKLREINVPFIHKFLDDYTDIVDYYHTLDLYLITSRTEGGPKAVLESLASGVPLVSTKVGMPADIIIDGKNGLLLEIEDVAGLSKCSEKLLSDFDLQKKVVRGGLETVKQYQWDNIAKDFNLKILSNLNS